MTRLTTVRLDDFGFGTLAFGKMVEIDCGLSQRE
jgi:hypothetical protein